MFLPIHQGSHQLWSEKLPFRGQQSVEKSTTGHSAEETGRSELNGTSVFTPQHQGSGALQKKRWKEYNLENGRGEVKSCLLDMAWLHTQELTATMVSCTHLHEIKPEHIPAWLGGELMRLHTPG